MSNQDILEKSTLLKPETNFEENVAWKVITDLHPSYVTLKPESVDVKQLGDYVRASFVFVSDGFSNRVIIEKSPAGTYDIIEECRLEPIERTETVTKVTTTGQTEMITNDIEKVTKNDETIKEVINNVQREVVEVKESEPVEIKATEFEKSTEYVVKFESVTTP